MAKTHFGSAMLQNISELENKSKTKLSLGQKILLAETGTVEQVLSILANSEVQVRVVSQKEGRRRITRESELVCNDIVMIRARSVIFLDNVPAKVAAEIRRKQSGIGTIISRLSLETFRKIVQVGYDPATGTAFRKYKILYKGKVAFEINENIKGGPGGI